MGNTNSEHFKVEDDEVDYWWNNNTEPNPDTSMANNENESEETDERRKQRLREELNEFKLELARKHEKRRQLIQEKHQEMLELRQQVKQLNDENEQLKKSSNNYNEIESLRKENNELKTNLEKIMSDSNKLDELYQRNRELKIIIANTQKELQEMNSEIMNFESERQDYKNHVRALKDVIAVSKQMLSIRENQLKELRQKVNEIEASIASKDLTTLSLDLQKEYEKQLENMRNLKIFYEERLKAHGKEKAEMATLLDATKQELQDEKQKNQELQSTVERLEDENSKKYDEIKSLESNLGLTKAECRQYQAELTVINQLFSQILLNFNNNNHQEMGIDRLIELLEENHHLLQDIAINEVSNETASALPKVLLDLVQEVSNVNNDDDGDDNKEKQQTENQYLYQLNSATEIVENLPKVWKILIQLLSQQCAPVNVLKDEGSDNPCYKVVETPKGSQSVLSVSRTFIRLKDLILEKKSLERETGHLKQLNTHLECRLQEQEKRLEMVSKELTETWHVVGQLQKKHQLLHTQEKILRYELAQKRKLLNQLKDELEYSREKWLEAREKNSTTEKQWEQLRNEFASRKSTQNDDLNNSLESGYSDGRECSSSNEEDEEPGYETDISECNQRETDEASTSTPPPPPPPPPQPIVDVIQNEILTIVAEAQTEILSDDNNSINNNDNNNNSQPGSSNSSSSSDDNTNEHNGRDLDTILSAREERLRRLEGQCNNLVQQVVNTTDRSAAISNRLDALHEIYGETSRDDTNRQEGDDDVPAED